jgi:anti-sigma B factor antagonist
MYETQNLSDGLLMKVHGDVTMQNSGKLREELLKLLEPGVSKLVIDLADVSFMDSAGVATLVEALRIQREAGHRLVLVNPQPKVLSVFKISRLTDLFTVVDDLEQADRV